MTDTHWAILALRDINSALDRKRYDVAAHHIDDAIFAILARDAQDTPIPRVVHKGCVEP